LKFGLNIFHTNQFSNALSETYNTIFSINSLIDHTDVSVILDNEAIFNI